MRKCEVTREELSQLRDHGLTRQQIADTIGTSLSTVKRLLTHYDLVNRRRPTGGIVELTPSDDRSPEAGRTSLERAKMRLGQRVGENAQGYTLDGRPATAWDLLRAAGLSHTE